MKKRILLLALLLALGIGSARADELAYRSYSYTPDGHPFYMQSPYLPVDIIGQSLYTEDASGELTAVPGLRAPSGLCVGPDQTLYVSDRGNNRVVQITASGVLLREYGLGVLKAPEGLYVDGDGSVYVADMGNAQVAVFNADGSVRSLLKAPTDVRLENLMFTPLNVAVDSRGYIYTQLRGGNEGLMLLSPDGRFQGYFGRNATVLSLGERLKRMIYTEEQIATNMNAVAPSITGMCVSRNGFIYTCTSTLSNGQIKKFNASGEDLFTSLDTRVTVDRRKGLKSAVSSLFVDENGVIYAVDSVGGAVIIYDANGKPLMMFGEKLSGNDRRIGFFSDPAAICVLEDGTLLVLDRAYNGIHVFQPTTLMKSILASVSLYNDGQYLKTQEGWQDILKANANYYWANLGLGKIAYMDKDYPEAMRRMRLAMNQEYYSDALWKQRAQVVQQNAGWVLAVLIGVAVLHMLLVKILRFNVFALAGRGIRAAGSGVVGLLYKVLPPLEGFFARMRFAPRVLRHPVDTYYDATRRGKGSVPSALCWYVIFLAVMIGERALTNFVFDAEGIRGVSLLSMLLTYVAPVILWIVGNFLVGAITKGQGTLKGIIISTVYALMPLILFTLPLAIISRALTLAEGSIYWIVRTVLYGWVALLLFTQVKEIHGYEFGETIKNILWILFVAAMTVVAVLTVAGILIQGYNFLNEFIRELLGYV